ncbi:hypothetical protein B0J17DRAFT_747855 [Rhizoctonia solani]|nr:hypothetical protein B0J17DRAFT_747855 [Rhizoctonia solani]
MSSLLSDSGGKYAPRVLFGLHLPATATATGTTLIPLDHTVITTIQSLMVSQLSPISTLMPKLPGDILYLVAFFSSFETRASPTWGITFSARDIGVLVKESKLTSPNLFAGPGISICMQFPEEIKRGSQSPVQDSLPWTKSMLSTSATPFDELGFLQITFETKPPFQSASSQLAAVEELYKEFPGLEEVTISYPELQCSRGVDHPGYKQFAEDSPSLNGRPIHARVTWAVGWTGGCKRCISTTQKHTTLRT